MKGEVKTLADLDRAKRRIAKKYKVPCLSNIVLLRYYRKLIKNKTFKPSLILERLLITRPMRSLSGIVNVSVLTKPYPCPGKCIFCPKEIGMPKSYLSGEPAAQRAKNLKFNPYLQVKQRIEMLENEGHATDKIELRIVGGTWSYYPENYKNWFIKRCFDACNNSNSTDLEKSQKINEKAKHRIIGLSIETRPDFITLKEIKKLRNYGATMVELGIQNIYDDVLNLVRRGHNRKTIITATKLLKDAGFKILYQMMPNLPGSNLYRDKKMFEELFSNPDFQPDYLKIYPCALLKNTPLYKLWKKKQYHPYSIQELTELIKSIKKKIPYYVRIQRIARDIPANMIIVGPAKVSNIRQLISINARKEKWQCKCIRCREVKNDYNSKEKLKLFRDNYNSSDGKEIFLSFCDSQERIYSLLRLRITSDNKAIIREIHTYGILQSIGETSLKSSPQHKGLGKKLIGVAEKIAKKEFNLNEIAVISGIGAREYYKKLGYKLKNSYMIKKIN